jgi:hypothetical protein
MAQTTGAVVFTGAKIEYATDGGTTYTDMSGFSKTVTVEGGERNSGQYYTADGDTAIVKGGKRTPVTVTVNFAYTVTTTDPYDTLRTEHETAGGGDCMIRFSPGGGNTGDFQYITDTNNVVLKNVTDPQGDVEPGDIIAVEVMVETSALTQSVVA